MSRIAPWSCYSRVIAVTPSARARMDCILRGRHDSLFCGTFTHRHRSCVTWPRADSLNARPAAPQHLPSHHGASFRGQGRNVEPITLAVRPAAFFSAARCRRANQVPRGLRIRTVASQLATRMPVGPGTDLDSRASKLGAERLLPSTGTEKMARYRNNERVSLKSPTAALRKRIAENFDLAVNTTAVKGSVARDWRLTRCITLTSKRVTPK